MKVVYMNCTASEPHIGCLAVTDYHIRELVESGFDIVDIIYADIGWAEMWKGSRKWSLNALRGSAIEARIAEADILVINGEGTMHHSPGKGMLAVAEAALEMSKQVYLVNTSFFAIDEYDDVLRNLADLNVRESLSSQHLTKRGIPHRLTLDSFLGASFSEDPIHDHAGRTVVTDWHANRDRDVGLAMIDLLKSDNDSLQFYPLKSASQVSEWRHAVADLKTAGMVVSGRYHGIYLAGLAGCPFVSLPSNTPKIEGLIKASGLPMPHVGNARDLSSAMKHAQDNPQLFQEFQSFLLAQRPLTTFQVIKDRHPLTKPDNSEADIASIWERISKHQNPSPAPSSIAALEKRVRSARHSALMKPLHHIRYKAKRARQVLSYFVQRLSAQ